MFGCALDLSRCCYSAAGFLKSSGVERGGECPDIGVSVLPIDCFLISWWVPWISGVSDRNRMNEVTEIGLLFTKHLCKVPPSLTKPFTGSSAAEFTGV